jgi:ribose 5-phosphate isomerase A
MELSPSEALKRRAAARALDYVESGMVLGLGTGSTVAHFLDLLGQKLRDGDLTDIVGIPTSVRTGREGRQAGIELVGLADRVRIDVTVDGTDEVTPELDLIKGMGGALLREKMVAQASDRLVIIADASKAVDTIGTKSPLPIEVVEWGQGAHINFLESCGAQVVVRMTDDGPPMMSDNGNLLLDCTFPGGIPDAAQLDAELHARAGVVETGLFLGLANVAILAGDGGIEVLEVER